jgi:hypothetical protein
MKTPNRFQQGALAPCSPSQSSKYYLFALDFYSVDELFSYRTVCNGLKPVAETYGTHGCSL